MEHQTQPRRIELLTYEPWDMLWLLVDGELEMAGNAWDWHAGCSGTEFAGYDLDGLWDRGARSAAGLVKLMLERDGYQVELVEREIDDQEAEQLA
jgi:hypothetical protein